jgi:hypothetical protein
MKLLKLQRKRNGVMHMRTTAVLAMGLALTACSTVKDVSITRLSASPVVDGGTYSSGGGITVAVDVIETEGLATVCGVWSQSAAQSVLTADAEKRVLGSGSVYLGETAVVRGMKFMREVEPLNSYANVPANCVQTWYAWYSTDADKPVSIRLPKQTLYSYEDEDGEVIVQFEQTGPGAGKL